jgi:RNA polymerase sigma-70 factor (ECF subfamily)
MVSIDGADSFDGASSSCDAYAENSTRAAAFLDRLRANDKAAWEILCFDLRPRLRRLADERLPREIQRRVDASDAVQQTLLEARRDIDHFFGHSMPDLMGWLLVILDHNVKDLTRTHLANCRSVTREISLDDSWAQGSHAWVAALADDRQPVSSLVGSEDRLALYEAIRRLPPRSRRAVRHS